MGSGPPLIWENKPPEIGGSGSPAGCGPVRSTRSLALRLGGSVPRSGTGGDIAPETRAAMIEVYYYNITFSELSDEVFGEGYKYGHVFEYLPTDHPGHPRSLRRPVARARTPTEIRAVESKKNGPDFVIINK